MKVFILLPFLLASACAAIPFVSFGYYASGGCDEISFLGSLEPMYVFPQGTAGCKDRAVSFEVSSGQVRAIRYENGSCTGPSYVQRIFEVGKCYSRENFGWYEGYTQYRDLEFIKFQVDSFARTPTSNDTVYVSDWSDQQCSSFNYAQIRYGLAARPTDFCGSYDVSGDVFAFGVSNNADSTVLASRTANVGALSGGPSTTISATVIDRTNGVDDQDAASTSISSQYVSTKSVSRDGPSTSSFPAGTLTETYVRQAYGPVSTKTTRISVSIDKFIQATSLQSGTFITRSGPVATTAITTPSSTITAELVVSGVITKAQAQAGLDKIEQRLLGNSYDSSNKRFLVTSVINLSKRQERTVITFTINERAGGTSSSALVGQFQDLVKNEPATFTAAGLPNPSLTVNNLPSGAVSLSFSVLLILIGLFI